MDKETKNWLKNHQQQSKDQPIHKFNNGRGATLCHTCGVIITEGLTKDLYCNECSEKQICYLCLELKEVGYDWICKECKDGKSN